MNKLTDTLKSLIASHGIEILQQEQRLKAMLADLLPNEKRKLYLVDLSLRADIPKKIMALQNETSEQWTVKANAHKHYFKEEYFLEDKPVNMIFDCWAEVLPRIEKKIIEFRPIGKVSIPTEIIIGSTTELIHNEKKSIHTDNIKKIETVLIPAGTFIMGSPETEVGNEYDETLHKVILTSFRISKYQITNAQYATFLNSKGIGSDGKYAAGSYPTDVLICESRKIDLGKNDWGLNYINAKWLPAAGYENYPVIYVSWYGAAEYASYIGGFLPTDAQWEYACRAETNTPFNTGNLLSNLQANYNWDNPYSGGNNTVTTRPVETQAVGSYPANSWGLYDMHGNVRGWCNDWYDDMYGQIYNYVSLVGYDDYLKGDILRIAQTNPKGPASGLYRVFRGGSWNDSAQSCRSAFRHHYNPSFYTKTVGFRVVFLT